MSKFQPAYNKEKKKEIRIMIPEIDDQIREFEMAKRNATDPDVKKAIEARIKALKIKKKSYKKGDPVKESNVDEEAQGAVTTGSVGVPTMQSGGSGANQTAPAIYGNSSIYAKHMGTMSRRGEYKAPDHCDCKKKKKKKNKKKTQKEFVDYYFENEQ